MKKSRVLLLSLVFMVASVRAENKVSALTAGLSSYEVATLLGEPQERIEMESARNVVWKYPHYDLIFHQGRLVGGPKVSKAPVGKVLKPPMKKKKSLATNDVSIAEILEGLPKDDGGAVAPPSPLMPAEEVAVVD